MKVFYAISIIFYCSFVFCQETVVEPFELGESIRFESTILQEERMLNVYLPESYSPDSTQNYPVIYLLDGSASEDFIHVSGLVQFCSFSWISLMPETIVVGISNVDRKRDFTFPTTIEQDRADFPTTGGSAQFIRCLTEEIIPLVEESYKTNGNKTLIGQSLGGLLATEILYTKTDVFDQYMIISPSLWWDNESLLEKEVLTLSSEQSVFVAVGAEGPIMKQGAKSLYKEIKKSNAMKARVCFEYFPEQNHGDVLHLALYSGFEKLFGNRKK